MRERSVEIREELSTLIGQHLGHLTAADQPMVDLTIDVLTKLQLVYWSRSTALDRRTAPDIARQLASLVEKVR